MKWKRGQGYDQIEDRRGQAGAGPDLGGLGAVVLGGAIGRKARGRRGRPDHRRRHRPAADQRRAGGGGGLLGAVGPGCRGGRAGRDAQPAGRDRRIRRLRSSTTSRTSGPRRSASPAATTRSPSWSCSRGRPHRAAARRRRPPDRSTARPTRRSTWTSASSMSSRSASARPGDFAMAYVIAHEFGHHIQTATGVSQAVQDTVSQDGSRSNELSVKQELQADCLAGVWAHSAISDLERRRRRGGADRGGRRRRRPDPAEHVRPHRPRVVDPWLLAAAPGLVHRRLPQRQRRDCDTFQARASRPPRGRRQDSR